MAGDMEMEHDDVKISQKYFNKYQSALHRGIAFKLSFTSYKNLMRAKKCYYTGIDLSDVQGAANQRTIDRIDNTKGYESGNVVACCFAFNQIKSVMEKDGTIHSPIFKKAINKMFSTLEKSSKQKALNERLQQVITT